MRAFQKDFRNSETRSEIRENGIQPIFQEQVLPIAENSGNTFARASKKRFVLLSLRRELKSRYLYRQYGRLTDLCQEQFQDWEFWSSEGLSNNHLCKKIQSRSDFQYHHWRRYWLRETEGRKDWSAKSQETQAISEHKMIFQKKGMRGISFPATWSYCFIRKLYGRTGSEGPDLFDVKQVMTEKITTLLYWGTVSIDFLPNSHAYKIDWNAIPSATSICWVLDKPALIPRAINCFKQLLLQTEWEITPEVVEKWSKERRRISEEAKDIWTIVHARAEAYSTWFPTEMPEQEEARNWVLAFLDREKEHWIKFLENERFVYSKKYWYCGKFDTIVECDWKKYLADFKTAKGFYPMEMWMQLAWYRNAYEEETGEKLDWQFIVRFDKGTGDFSIHRCKDYEKDLEAFLSALTLYKRKKELDKEYRNEYF